MVGGKIIDFKTEEVDGIYTKMAIKVRGTQVERNDCIYVKIRATSDDMVHIRHFARCFWHDKIFIVESKSGKEIQLEKVGYSFGHHHLHTFKVRRHIIEGNGTYGIIDIDSMDWMNAIRDAQRKDFYLFKHCLGQQKAEVMLEETIYEVYHNNEWKRCREHEEACPHCGLQAQFHNNVTDCPPTTYF
jgi:hypothetical protein